MDGNVSNQINLKDSSVPRKANFWDGLQINIVYTIQNKLIRSYTSLASLWQECLPSWSLYSYPDSPINLDTNNNKYL